MISIISDPLCRLHVNSAYHPERPERLEAIETMLRDAPFVGQLHHMEARDATDEELMVDPCPVLCQANCGNPSAGAPDAGSRYRGRGGFVGCRHSSCGSRHCCRRCGVSRRQSRTRFAFGRPPGHHAEHDRALGFCLFNNVAIAAEHGRRVLGLERILIVDWDVHHGNGTQNSFYARDDVFYFSVHQYPLFPGTGRDNERGVDKGQGYTLNVAWPPGQGDERYLELFRNTLAPVARAYRPQVILVSAGFDAHRDDPLGGMHLTTQGFGALTRELQHLADEVCVGRMVFVLEGGYDLDALQSSVQMVLATLLTDR